MIIIVGDSLTVHNGRQFTTHDADNDISTSDNCGHQYGGGWWFEKCLNSNLNGVYYNQSSTLFTGLPKGIEWEAWHGYYYSLKATEMKLIPVP